MEQNRSRLLLRKIFQFRLFSFVVSFLILYLRIRYEVWNDIDEKGWIIGVAGSALVWSMVEMVDFFVKTYEQYCKERVRFWAMVVSAFSEVENVIKADLENISWSVEVAMPWSVLKECAFENRAPKHGEYWRINFSRVEWRTEIIDGKYSKIINPATGKPYPLSRRKHRGSQDPRPKHRQAYRPASATRQEGPMS